nr:putative reverse transcriptase domain-containing protein [Tanacetum cinerariifolium]
MPPKRNNNIYDVYERIMARMEERLDQFVDQFTNQMNDMINPRIRGDRNGRRSKGEESENPFFDGDDSSLFVERKEWEDDRVADDDYEEGPVFDNDPYEEKIVSGDVGEFSDVFHDELLDEFPPLCDIQHHIDLEPSSQLPNRPHYRLCPREHEELRKQVEEFISNGHIHKIMSTCAHPRGPLDLMSLHVSGSVPKKVQDFVEGLPYHGDSSDDDLEFEDEFCLPMRE